MRGPPRPLLTGSHPDVVEEHAEEAAFLVAQRRYLARTGQATWGRLAGVERRLDAHLDGLLVAEDAGRQQLGRSVPPGASAAYIATRLAAADGPGAALDAVGDELADAEVEATAEALVHHATGDRADGWTAPLAAALGDASPSRVRVAARVLGQARLPAGAELVRALARAPGPDAARAIVDALGRLRYPPARSTVRLGYLARPALARVAAGALLRMGNPQGLAWFGRRLADDPDAPLALAVAGGPDEGAALAALARSEAPAARARALLALGVHGDPAHVGLLLDALDDEPETAALALRVLTGAPLVEEALVPDDPGHPEDGGDWVCRPLRRAADWRAWWDAHGAALQPGVRHRAGQPFRAAVAAAAPVGGPPDDLLPGSLRDALASELAVRYGLDGPFQSTAYVRRQRRDLARLSASAPASDPAGTWGRRPG